MKHRLSVLLLPAIVALFVASSGAIGIYTRLNPVLDDPIADAKKAAAAAQKTAKEARDLNYRLLLEHLQKAQSVAVDAPADGLSSGSSNTDLIKPAAKDWSGEEAAGPVAVKAHQEALKAIGTSEEEGHKKALTDAAAALEEVEGSEEAVSEIESAEEALTAAEEHLEKNNKTLGENLAKTCDKVAGVAFGIEKEIGVWAGLKSEKPEEAMPILERFQTSGPQPGAFHDFLSAKAGGRALWDGSVETIHKYAKELGSEVTGDAAGSSAVLKDAADALAGLDKKYGSWFGVAQILGAAMQDEAAKTLREFYDSPADTAVKVQTGIGKLDTYCVACDALEAVWPALSKKRGFKSGDAVLKSFASLMEVRESAGLMRGQLRDAMAGNADLFVSDQISLYYFTDVSRLMAALNPDVKTVRPPITSEDYERVRKEMIAKEIEMRNAYDKLAGLTTQLVNLSIKLEAAKTAQKTAKDRRDLYANNLKIRKDEKDKADAEVERLTAEPPPEDATPEKIKDAKDKAEKAKAAYDDADKEDKQAKAELDEADKRVSDDLNEKNGLPAQIHAAQVAAITGSTILKEKRNELAVLTRSENLAFAIERDNQPFLQAYPNALSPDPARRVYLYAYGDSKTLFIRGLPDDVEAVKDIVADFDRPAPQARITLWSLQMNVQATRNGRQRLGNAMEKVEKHLSEMRRFTAMATSILRDEVNLEVQRVERDRRSWFTHDDYALDDELYARFCFYNPEVARRLGFYVLEAMANPRAFYFTRWTLPDPAGTTTLGETLMVLSLADEVHRIRIINQFEARLRELAKDDKYVKEHGLLADSQSFPRLKRALNLDKAAPLPVHKDGTIYPSDVDYYRASSNLTPHQLEITRALQRAALERFIQRAPDVTKLYLLAPERRMHDFFNTVHAELLPGKGPGLAVALGSFGKGLLEDSRSDMELAANSEAIIYLTPALFWMRAQMGVSAGIFEAFRRADEGSQQWQADVRQAWRHAYPRAQANARIAAADQMLKELMIAIEDDVDEHFVQPALKMIRRDMLGEGLDVSVIERTGLLTTNRTVGRVDPSASASLDLAGEQNLIAAAQQLSAVVTALQKNSLPEILKVLDSTSKEPKSELYALFSGNEFKVTPIFDPSGQALRFQFDHVQQTDIRDPDGTKNPQLPRVDRHSVNTVVQLSNLELREISRFETDTKLGVPRKQWGGIPLLNQIPILNELPIIGWFSRRNGQAAVSQHSLIFAQTAMYPTIGDISALLTGSLAIPPLNAAPGRTGDRNSKDKKGKGKD